MFDSTLADLRPSASGDMIYYEDLIVDTANGVGASKLAQLQKLTPSLNLTIRNKGEEGDGSLNDGVGADFVQKEKVPPQGFGIPADILKR